jgi:hypothetical protein
MDHLRNVGMTLKRELAGILQELATGSDTGEELRLHLPGLTVAFQLWRLHFLELNTRRK